MNILKTAFMTTALVLGTASAAFAQDAMPDKAKDMAVDKATSMAKDKAKEAVGDDKAQYINPAAKVGKNMLKGDSAKDAVVKMGTSEAKGAVMGGAVMGGDSVGGMTSTTLSTDESITAGKVILNGGSTEDAAMAVAKKRAKDHMMDKAEGMMAKEIGSSTVVMDDAVVESSTVVATDPSGVIAPVQATVTTTTTPAAVAPMAAPAAIAVNCPAGTTAQADGSCMITGNYQPKK